MRPGSLTNSPPSLAQHKLAAHRSFFLVGDTTHTKTLRAFRLRQGREEIYAHPSHRPQISGPRNKARCRTKATYSGHKGANTGSTALHEMDMVLKSGSASRRPAVGSPLMSFSGSRAQAGALGRDRRRPRVHKRVRSVLPVEATQAKDENFFARGFAPRQAARSSLTLLTPRFASPLA